MDIWGVGCVFFEVLSLFPLFPGTNELDQVNKIHNVLGTPPIELLNRFKKHASHMDFNFPQKEGTGIDKLASHISPEAKEIILLLLVYDPDQRISARQALKHQYFAELREQDKRMHRAAAAVSPNNKMLVGQEEEGGGQYSNQQSNQSQKKGAASYKKDKQGQQQQIFQQSQKLPEIKQEIKLNPITKENEEEQKTNLPPIKLIPQVKNYNMYMSDIYKQPQQKYQQQYIKTQIQESAYKNMSNNFKKDFYKKPYISPYSQKIVYKPLQKY